MSNQKKITIKIEGDTAGGINAIGHHILTMLKGIGWSYRVRLPMLPGGHIVPPGMSQMYGTLALVQPEADLHVDLDTAVVLPVEPGATVEDGAEVVLGGPVSEIP